MINPSRHQAVATDELASAISEVSVEILVAIFREAFRWNSAKISYTISHVSRTWSAVALNDPLLWNTIHLTGSKPSYFTQLCLTRSKQSDLRVLYEKHVDVEFDGALVPPFDPAIFYLPRCHRLELYFHNRVDAFAVLEALKNARAPKLACFELEIGGIPEHWPKSHYPGSIFTGGAPLLTAAALKSVGISQCRVPLSNITTLSLKGCSPESGHYPYLNPFASEFVDILREAAPTLQCLTLDGGQVFSRKDKPWSVVELPALTTLSFGNTAVDNREAFKDYPRGFWKFVKMPRLGDLSLHSIDLALLQEIWSTLEGHRGARIKALSLYRIQELHELDKGVHEIFTNIHSLAIDCSVVHGILANIVYADKKCTGSRSPPVWPLLEAIRGCE
ncbi:hypothetical protein HWV62_42348 [Athelia sp. TMB]|nr:hypothetical protein HWV62_42348 [Athelia sp. TMB]